MVLIPILLNILCIAITIFAVFRENRQGRVPLISMRNVFLFGYLYFQSFGFFSWLFDRKANGWWHNLIKDNNYETSIIFGLMLNAFLLVFLFAYRSVNFRLKKVPYTQDAVIPSSYFFGLSIILTIMALTCWVIGFFALKTLMGFIATGIGATATGLAAWGWTKHVKDPFSILLVLTIALLNMIPSLTEYGRRGIVSVAGIVVWVLYYRVAFRFNPVKVAVVAVLVSVPVLILLAAFSEARVKRPDSTVEAIEYMWNADIPKGLQRLATFQGSSVISMWCIEHFPDKTDYRHCHTAKAFFHFFIPRMFWKDKPDGLGRMIPELARLRNVGGLNVGAGLVGHAAAEGGWYALILYAVLLAIFLKLLDQLILARPDPLYRIPIAASLGNLFATPRGEVSFFLDIMVISIICGFVALFIATRIFKVRVPQQRPIRIRHF